MTRKFGTLFVASTFALALGVGSALAAGEPDPRPTNPPASKAGDTKPKQGSKKKKEQKSEREVLDGYRAAYALKQAGDYKAAFDVMLSGNAAKVIMKW